MFVITRQHQWATGDYVVEISAGGLDYTNPDALVAKYDGEFKEFKDPREAIDKAVAIAKQWKKDSKEDVLIAIGQTYGDTIPFEGKKLTKKNIKELVNYGKTLYDRLRKCDQCSKILDKTTYGSEHNYDEEFCSENCAEKAYHENKEFHLHDIIDELSREKIIAILEGADIVCYDNESDKTLREALLVNVMDGTIDENYLYQ